MTLREHTDRIRALCAELDASGAADEMERLRLAALITYELQAITQPSQKPEKKP